MSSLNQLYTPSEQNFYIGYNDKLSDFLRKHYNFKIFKISKLQKNNILELQKFIETISPSSILVSDNIPAYFLYYASDYFLNKTILINPIFFMKNGSLMSPSSEIIFNKSNPNKLLMISDSNPNLTNFKKLFKNDKIVVNNGIIEKLTEYIKNDISVRNKDNSSKTSIVNKSVDNQYIAGVDVGIITTSRRQAKQGYRPQIF